MRRDRNHIVHTLYTLSNLPFSCSGFSQWLFGGNRRFGFQLKALYLRKLGCLCNCSCTASHEIALNTSKQALIGRLTLARPGDNDLTDEDLSFVFAALCTMDLLHDEVSILETFTRFRLQTDMETGKRKPWLYSFMKLMKTYFVDFTSDTTLLRYANTCRCLKLSQMNWPTLLYEAGRHLDLIALGHAEEDLDVVLKELSDAILGKNLQFHARKKHVLSLHKLVFTSLLHNTGSVNAMREAASTRLRVIWSLYITYKTYFRKEDLNKSAALLLGLNSSSVETHNLMLCLASCSVPLPVAVIALHDAEYEASSALVQASWWYLRAKLRLDDARAKRFLPTALNSESQVLQRAAAFWVLALRIKNEDIKFLALCIIENLPLDDPMRTTQKSSLGWGHWVAQRSTKAKSKSAWSIDTNSELLIWNKL